jgi:hypothetical protein
MIKKILIITFLAVAAFASLSQQSILIKNIVKNSAMINIGNLKVGQSGVIVHYYTKDKSIIISTAIVEQSGDNSSKIIFSPFKGLIQNALPKTNRKPQNGDTFIVNYLYQKSLLIAPNGESYTNIQNFFPYQHFLNSDIFASYLKLEENPTPQKNDFIKFCKIHNLGTIYFIIEKNFYIVDANSFKIIEILPMVYNNTKTEQPFYTKVDKIESGLFDFDFKFDLSFLPFIDKSTKTSGDNYTIYYKNLLGL